MANRNPKQHDLIQSHDRFPRAADQPLHKLNRNYQLETRRPIVCLAFILPWLLFYEFAAIFVDQQGTRSGLDEWLNWGLTQIGMNHVVILPLVTVALLLGWHHRLDDGWRFSPRTLAGMTLESAVLGMILYFAALAVDQAAGSSPPEHLIIPFDQFMLPTWAQTISYVGSGVYEELVFRLILLTALIQVGRLFCSAIHQIQVACILISSLVFVGLHYQLCNPAGAEFDTVGFVFRFFASLVFCILYLYRGFGIAAGTHATYDVLTLL